jgi:hypothetical protein
MRELFHPGRCQIEAPLRSSDLIHSQDATLARTEELLALDRIPLAKVELLSGIFLLRPTLSPCFFDWWKSLRSNRHHHWMDSAQLDAFGTQLFLSHAFIAETPTKPFHKPINSPLGAYAAVCSWRDAPRAAGYLRSECLGPILLSAYGTDLFPITSSEITQRLALCEGSLNSSALPHYCRMEWGILLRTDRDNVSRILEYFNFDQPTDCSIPAVAKLGGLTSSIYAFSPSEVRLALCPEHQKDLAVYDLGRWLRSFESPNPQKKELATT